MAAPALESAPATGMPTPTPVPRPEIDLYGLLELNVNDSQVADTLGRVALSAGLTSDDLEKSEKKYSEATYHIYPRLSLSISSDAKTHLITQIDLTSPLPPPSSSISSNPSASSSTLPPIPFPLSQASSLPWPLTLHSTPLDLLAVLGEPARKGGGLDNVGRLGPGVWLEWTSLPSPPPLSPNPSAKTTTEGEEGRPRGLYVEFEVRGQGCWERSSLEGQRWKSCMLF